VPNLMSTCHFVKFRFDVMITHVLVQAESDYRYGRVVESDFPLIQSKLQIGKSYMLIKASWTLETIAQAR
jgi:hypothetical protein